MTYTQLELPFPPSDTLFTVALFRDDVEQTPEGMRPQAVPFEDARLIRDVTADFISKNVLTDNDPNVTWEGAPRETGWYGLEPAEGGAHVWCLSVVPA